MKTKTIWKFPLQVTDEQTISAPCSPADVLCVQVQNDQPCLWAAVDPAARQATLRVRTYGTGQPIDLHDIDTGHYVGTYQLHGGMVFHVFVG